MPPLATPSREESTHGTRSQSVSGRTATRGRAPRARAPTARARRGTRWGSAHVIGIYAIWKFAESPDLAKKFLLDLVDHYRDAVLASKLYNLPALPGSVADAGVPAAKRPAAGQAWLEQVTASDPFGPKPPA